MLQLMELHGMIIILKVILGNCAAVLGTIIRGIVARRIGTGSMRAAGTTTSVFGLLFFFSRISCSLPFCFLPFANPMPPLADRFF
jgi:hypothetical protein